MAPASSAKLDGGQAQLLLPERHWNTAYLERAVEELWRQRLEVADDDIEHLSPLGWEHIALTGEYRWQLKDARSLQGVVNLSYVGE